MPHIRSMSVEERTDALTLDAATRRNLELDVSMSGNAEATLFSLLDRCVDLDGLAAAAPLAQSAAAPIRRCCGCAIRRWLR